MGITYVEFEDEAGVLRRYRKHVNGRGLVATTAKVDKTAYQDPKTDEDWSAIEVVPVKKLAVPVTLAQIKAHKQLSKMQLVKKSRISVVPVTGDELALVLSLAKTKL